MKERLYLWFFTNYQKRIIDLIVYLIIGTMLYVFFLMFCPFKVLEVKSVKILTPQVKLGGTFEMLIDYCKYIDNPATVSRSLLNDRIVSLTPYVSTLPKGCQTKIVSVVIPENMFPSKYEMVTANIYVVNFIRTETVTYRTEKFEILPKDLTDLEEHELDDKNKFDLIFKEHQELVK